MSENNNLTIETLLAIVILMVYTVASPIFEKKNFHYMHESGLCMIIGIIITFIAMFVVPGSNFADTFNFDDQIFFTFILPPIIFSAGYNLRRTTFFKYFMYIVSFGVIGTVISFLVVTPLTCLGNKYDLFYFTYHPYNNKTINVVDNSTDNLVRNLIENITNITVNNITNSTDVTTPIKEPNEIIHFTLSEILLFASVISATDTIAALTFVKEESEPKLFAILFGEGVLNDAVCIVLYRILRDFTSSGQEFSVSTPLMMLNSFISLFFSSFLMGVLMGVLCAYMLKYFKDNNINLSRTQEISVLIFFAFFTYTLTESLGLSPIISLLFCGMIMSNYAFYNISFQAREESTVVSRIMSNIAEAFVFTYLGLTLLYYLTHSLSISFILIELFIVVLGRVVAIFGLTWLISVFGAKSFKLKTSQKGIMSYAGSIRGAIAFGLALGIETSNKSNKEVLISSTLILVFFTTVFFGALMPLMIRLLKKLDKDDSNQVGLISPIIDQGKPDLTCENFSFVHPNFSTKYEGSKEQNIEVLRNRLSYWVGHYWFEFDEVYIKPRLCYQWPWTKENNMNLKNVIIKACHTYEEEQRGIDHNPRPILPRRQTSHLAMGERPVTYVELNDMRNNNNNNTSTNVQH